MIKKLIGENVDDIKNLKQLIENVKSNINNVKEKDNKNFHYQNNGNLITIIIKRFLEQNITEDSKFQIITNNIETEKEIKKLIKKINVSGSIFLVGIIPSILSTIFTSTLMITGEEFDYQITVTISTVLITIISMFYLFKFSEIEDKKRESNRSLISDNNLKNYNTQILKVVLSIIEDINSLQNTENAEYIEIINKRLIEEAYLFENGKTKDFMDNSLKTMILNRLSQMKFTEENKIESKLIKNDSVFEDIPLENKLDFLKTKII